MATTAGFKFPGPIGTKRRRMRSGGNVSTMSNNEPVVTLAEADDVGEKIVQTSKCKGATTIPIFLKSKFTRSNVKAGRDSIVAEFQQTCKTAFRDAAGAGFPLNRD